MALPFSKMMSCGAISGCAGWAASCLAAISRFACSTSCRKAASEASSSASLGIILHAVRHPSGLHRFVLNATLHGGPVASSKDGGRPRTSL